MIVNQNNPPQVIKIGLAPGFTAMPATAGPFRPRDGPGLLKAAQAGIRSEETGGTIGRHKVDLHAMREPPEWTFRIEGGPQDAAIKFHPDRELKMRPNMKIVDYLRNGIAIRHRYVLETDFLGSSVENPQA
jgi:hypothetical protein